MTEIWKPIPGFPGYEASDMGRVRTHRCGGRFGSDLRRSEPRIMLGLASREGYRRVGLRDAGGKRRIVGVHHCVLLAFVGPRPPGHQGSHLNGDAGDNRIANVCWETSKVNNGHKKLHGTQPRYLGPNNPSAKLSDEQRAALCAEYATGKVSQRELGRKYGIAQSSAGDIIRAGRRPAIAFGFAAVLSFGC